uniref:DNA primase n=1 Tax=Leptospirillum sp. Group II '5-way CG' TaxID=419541 RepID=B6AQ61_9BACT|nr:MAG: DNA primase [Leptospirillum sp. Group II '5-way CG']
MDTKKGVPRREDATMNNQQTHSTAGFLGKQDEFLDPPVRPDGRRKEGAEGVDYEAIFRSLPPGDLSSPHRKMLKDSGINDTVTRQRGYRTLFISKESRSVLKSLGFSSTQIRLPALLIPIYSPTGFITSCQIRPDDPRIRKGKPVKYETPFNAKNVLDIHPCTQKNIGNPDEPLFITEGIKKGDALASLGLVAISLSGVWNWRGKNAQGGNVSLPDWEDVAIKGREIRIVFDSDSASNNSVLRAEKRLAQFLEGRGGIVKILRIPPGIDGAKVGIDDFLAQGGDLTTLEEATEEVRPVITSDELGVAEALDDGSNLIFAQSKFWAFSETEGIWRESPEESVKRAIQIVCRENGLLVKDNFVRGAFNSAKARFFRDVQFDQIDKRSIGAANGVLRYIDGGWSLTPYRREDYRRIRLPVTYDPKAKCPRFEQFLSEVFDGTPDKRERGLTVLEFLGLSMTATTEYEKALLLVGKGGNGKSVLLRVLESLIGGKNRSSVQLKQLENRFQRAHLDGKLVNIMSELSEGGEVPDAEIKAIISGEPITAEHKQKHPFEFFPVCKLWIATNHMPSVRDLSDGLFRRFVILNFPNRFDDKPSRDTKLSEKLAAEASGILNYCLKALSGVYERESLTEPTSSLEAVQGWKRDSDQTSQFLEDEMILEPGASIASSEAYHLYVDWAKEVGIKRTLGRKSFTERLVNHGVEPAKGPGGVRLLWGLRGR